jgi:NAD-dependent SIR2 family protein deacetylase
LDRIKCEKCGVYLETVKTSAAYLGFRFPVDLPGCPSCGRIYVPEDLVRTRIAELETMLEEK